MDIAHLLNAVPKLSLGQYLRPVDLLELSLTSQRVQGVLLDQKRVVKDAYHAYYGPVLTAFRIREHNYLQLNTVEAVQYFLHKSILKNQTLRRYLKGHVRVDNDPGMLNEVWRRALLGYFDIEYQPGYGEIDPDYYWGSLWEWARKYYQWSAPYLPNTEFLSATSKDFATVLLQTYLGDRDCCNPKIKVLQYGYAHDALKKYGLCCLMELSSDYSFNSMEKKELPFNFLSNFLKMLPDPFCTDIKKDMMHYLMEEEPTYRVLSACLCIWKCEKLDTQLDMLALLKEFFQKMLSKCEQQQSVNLSDSTFEDIQAESKKYTVNIGCGELLLKYQYQLSQILPQNIAVTSLSTAFALIELVYVFSARYYRQFDLYQCDNWYVKLIADKVNKGERKQAELLTVALAMKLPRQVPDDTRSSYTNVRPIVAFDSQLFKDVQSALLVVTGLFEYACLTFAEPKDNLFRSVWAFFRNVLSGKNLELVKLALAKYSKLHDTASDEGEDHCSTNLHKTLHSILFEACSCDMFVDFVESSKDIFKYSDCILAGEFCAQLVRQYDESDEAYLVMSDLLERYAARTEADSALRTANFIEKCTEDYEEATQMAVIKLEKSCSAEYMQDVCSNLSKDVAKTLGLRHAKRRRVIR
ncbi:hypothetical protein MP228_002537 [Amoeboaphelidium protococcarum]|nr:hypothetical protein MP228_002537 [Amoeboaphelidium protococcarum]